MIEKLSMLNGHDNGDPCNKMKEKKEKKKKKKNQGHGFSSFCAPILVFA